MWDAYLICQALGWEWNFWTMSLITGVEILIGIILVICGLVVTAYLQNRKWK